jgi:hypothetical protein
VQLAKAALFYKIAKTQTKLSHLPAMMYDRNA